MPESEDFRIRLPNQVVFKVLLEFFGGESLNPKKRIYMPKNKIVGTGFTPKLISGQNLSIFKR